MVGANDRAAIGRWGDHRATESWSPFWHSPTSCVRVPGSMVNCHQSPRSRQLRWIVRREEVRRKRNMISPHGLGVGAVIGGFALAGCVTEPKS
jgi:hypothetical protein